MSLTKKNLLWLGFKTFKSYIMGTRFKVVTDHHALKALVNKASLEGQLACWADFLMGFDMGFVFLKIKIILMLIHLVG